jgi:hypothetical protein
MTGSASASAGSAAGPARGNGTARRIAIEVGQHVLQHGAVDARDCSIAPISSRRLTIWLIRRGTPPLARARSA